jgi:CheY-like chemotaxis protein
VLLAEDNPVNQRLATHILERLGHEVTHAGTGREVLELLETGDFDLILMDIQMPELGGVEATQRIRARESREGGHIPIVAMTAHAMTGDRERFLAAGMDEYISKPISQERLREVVRSLGRQPDGAVTGESDPSGISPTTEDASVSPPFADGPPTIDREGLLARVESDLELLSTLVGVFRADRPNLMGAIEVALQTKDARALGDAAHTLKGALSVFGVEPARSLAERLEKLGREGRLDAAPDLVDRLGAAVVAAEDGLDRLLRELA